MEFLKALTDERVRNETAPFDHPELIIPDDVDESGAEILLSLAATGGAPAIVPPALIMSSPLLPAAPTTLTTLAADRHGRSNGNGRNQGKCTASGLRDRNRFNVERQQHRSAGRKQFHHGHRLYAHRGC